MATYNMNLGSNALNSTSNLGVYSLFQRIQHQRTEISRMLKLDTYSLLFRMNS